MVRLIFMVFLYENFQPYETSYWKIIIIIVKSLLWSQFIFSNFGVDWYNYNYCPKVGTWWTWTFFF
jgi:hypothetical protein